MNIHLSKSAFYCRQKANKNKIPMSLTKVEISHKKILVSSYQSNQMPRKVVKRSASPSDKEEMSPVLARHSSPEMRDGESPNLLTVSKKKEIKGVNDEEFGFEMKKMLESFEVDITKTLANKRKRLETFTQNKMKNSNKKIDEIWKMQQTERQKLYDDYCNQMNNILQQWDVDLSKSKEQEEKLLAVFKQHQKLCQQNSLVQQQKLMTLHELHEQFCKGLKDLERNHQEQQSTVLSELKKEMALLQKRILMDTQQQEMANVRKSLQSMLF
ncbi:synaptonemal complex protein 3-like [Octopus sinensis]|uniref:Synaptonemal complex protein 3-like n=1 Tax=Octopus sinensis TaxID=2607531 RepID=A0A6P7SM49_9MOLL|nr:synaptonemal complex protein 3-like [Octopus sinensis]